MNTALAVGSIKLGSRVLYVANDGVEHNAVALDIPHIGFNQALKLHSAFLSLIYVNDLAEVVKINGAPLLGAAADGDHLKSAAVSAAKNDSRWFDPNVDNENLTDEHLQRIASNPRTIGWRPDGAMTLEEIPEGWGVMEQPSPVGQHAGDLRELRFANDGSGRLFVKLATDCPMQKSSGIDGDAGDWTQTAGAGLTDDTSPVYETKTYADESTATGVAPLPDLSPSEQEAAGLPSAADLDAVAEEQSIAEATDLSPAEPTAQEPSADNSAETAA